MTAWEAYERLMAARREIWKVACLDIRDMSSYKLVMHPETWGDIVISIRRYRDEGLVVVVPEIKFAGFDVEFDDRLEPGEMVFRNEIKIP